MQPVMRPEPNPVPLSVVARHLGLPDGGAGASISGVTLDSRAVRPGDIYAALPGHSTHGARFVADAISAGAGAVLTDPEGAAALPVLDVPVLVVDVPRNVLGALSALVYGEPAESMQVLGVTGTNGKTTVATMVDAGLRAAGRTTGMIGTVGVQVAGVTFPGARTTPEAPDLQGILAMMRERRVASMVMEVSSIAIRERRVDGLVYDVVGFTNLSQDHLDYHGTMESYFESKAALFTPERARAAVIGMDDDWGRELVRRCSIPYRTWSLLDPRADWRAQREPGGLVVHGPGSERQALSLRLPGAFNVANAVCAYAMLRAADVDPESAASGISSVEVPGRMQVVGTVDAIAGIVDYAHSPDAIERVLRAARETATGRVIAVVGAGGDRDRSKRPLMGATAAGLADVVVITDDNPRSEDPESIRESIREGALRVAPVDRAVIQDVGDRAAAISAAVSAAEPGDVVMVLGKGHEQGQEVAGVVSPFDDAAVLRQALDERLRT